MKVSEAIAFLQNAIDEFGDVEFIMLTDNESGEFCEVKDPVIDVIQFPEEGGSLSEPVCMAAWPWIFNPDDVDEEETTLSASKTFKLLQ